MTLFFKPYLGNSLDLQDDHYVRVADICFRHLAGAYYHHKQQVPYKWVYEIKNDSPDYGRLEHLNALNQKNFHQSEEYSQVIACLIFAHIWILSAANYYRLSCKHQAPNNMPWLDVSPINSTHSPVALAEELNLPAKFIDLSKRLHSVRNTIAHLNEGDPKTERIEMLDFNDAYIIVQATWVIFTALLRHYNQKPYPGSWLIQTKRYKLPPKV